MDLARFCWVLDYHRYGYTLYFQVAVYFSHADKTVGCNTSSWTAGSTLLALGLSVSQAMGVVVGSSLIIAILAVVAGVSDPPPPKFLYSDCILGIFEGKMLMEEIYSGWGLTSTLDLQLCQERKTFQGNI